MAILAIQHPLLTVVLKPLVGQGDGSVSVIQFSSGMVGGGTGAAVSGCCYLGVKGVCIMDTLRREVIKGETLSNYQT